jgi:hypothetical protein
MRDFANFCWQCIETTLRPTWDTATTVGVITTLILAAVLVANPEKEHSATSTLAKLTILLLILVFLSRLAVSPYLVYRSREGEMAARDTQISHLKSQLDERDSVIKDLKRNDQLAVLLQGQIELSKKGSLSNRASTLANQILETVEAHRKEDDHIYDDERSKSMAAKTEAERQAAWNEMTQRHSEFSAAFERTFHQRFTPRIIATADEFRENGLTDPNLERWVQHPHLAAYTSTLTEVAVALSQLAIKMEEKEKGAEK